MGRQQTGELVSMETGIQWTAAHVHTRIQQRAGSLHQAGLAGPQGSAVGGMAPGPCANLPLLCTSHPHLPAPPSTHPPKSICSEQFPFQAFLPWPESQWPSLVLTLDRHSPAPELGRCSEPPAGASLLAVPLPKKPRCRVLGVEQLWECLQESLVSEQLQGAKP